MSSREATGKTILFYCAYGERSAMAVEAAQDAGIATARHISGGLDAWKKAGGAVVRYPSAAPQSLTRFESSRRRDSTRRKGRHLTAFDALQKSPK